MSNIGDPITQPIPAVGTAGTTYAEEINEFLEEVQSRLETPISASSILGADLDQENNPVLNVAYVQLYPQDTDPVTASIYNKGGNLFFIGPDGTVQITADGDLNAAGIGGIGGDYGSPNPALVSFEDGTKTYHFYDDGSTLAYGYVRGLGLEIAGASISAVRARIVWGGSSSYTLTLPSSLPATQKLLQLTAGGTITASGVLAADENITISGTGDYKHGDKNIVLPGEIFYSTGTIVPSYSSNVLSWSWSQGGFLALFVTPQFKKGDRLKTIKIYGKLASGTNEPTVTLRIQNDTGVATLASTTSGTFTSSGGEITVTVTSPVTFGNNEFLQVSAVSGAAPSAPSVYRMSYTFDRP